MKKFFGKKGSSQSFQSQLPLGELASIDEKSPVVLRRTLDGLTLGHPGVGLSQNGSASSLPALSKSNPTSPITYTPPSLRRLKKTKSHDQCMRSNLTSFSSGASLYSDILTQSDSMTSLSRDSSSLNSSMTSLSIADNSPLSSSMNLTESFNLGKETKANNDVEQVGDSMTSSVHESDFSSTSEKKKKKGIFRLPFIHRHKDDKKRRGSADMTGDLSPTGRNKRSQSLTTENIGDLLNRIQEENADLQLAVRGKDEELKLLNASIDISNRTWESKVEALQKDVIQQRKKNEKLTQMITHDLHPTTSKRVPVELSPKSPNRKESKESHESVHETPVIQRRGVWEPSRKFIVTRNFEKTPEVRHKLEKALLSSKCLSQLPNDIITKIVDVMKVKRINKGERLMAESTLGANFYVLAEGDCRIYKSTAELSKGSNLMIGERVPLWSVFGETDIFYHTRRVSSCKSVQPGVVWFISRDEYTSVVRQQDINKRKKEIYNFLRKIECFRNVERVQFQDLIKQCKVEHFSNGDYMVRQGDAITNILVIKEGSVRVTKHIDGTESLLETLTVGHVIGDVTDSSTHVGNYIATDSEVVQCIVIPSEKFKNIRHLITSPAKQVTSEHVEKNFKMHFTSSDGGSEGSESSGYGSESRKRNRSRNYGEKHEMEYRKISEKLQGKSRDQFNYISTIGNGAFGTVDLVATNSGEYHVFAIKKLSRQEILQSEQQQQVRSERALQLHTSQHCPFIASLYKTFEDNKFVYLVMEYCAGGELFSLLKRLKRFENNSARFYSACMIEALAYLHSRHIVFRDLKPENVVINKNGYCKLTDFGFAKHLGGGRTAPRTYTFCGTPEYMAPETILYKAQTVTVDLWALGIFIFELLTGKAPFRNSNRKDLGELILGGIQTNLEEAKENKILSESAFSLIDELCQIRPEERIGSGRNGFDDISAHPWFQGFDWMSLRLRTLQAPWIPKLKTAHDTHYFDTSNKEAEREFENFDGTCF